MHAVRGTIDWYCVEYWSDTLELDIVELKTKTAHRLRVRPKVAEFLASVRKVKGAVHLVTNAHRKTIGVKFAWTGLGDFFDDVISSHDYGIPKEETAFWVELFSRHQFDPARTLFVDDNPEVLRSARAFGIGHLRAIAQPDSGVPGTDVGEFHPIRSFEEIMP
jgi:putative hydrolase of the HAD superfamily